MRLIITFIALACFSLQAMEVLEEITVNLKNDKQTSISPKQHKLLYQLSKTYTDIAQDTEKELSNTQVITLNNIPKRSFLFIKKHLKQLDRLGNPTPENKDQKAFNKLKNDFNSLSDHRRKSIKQIVTYLDLPKTNFPPYLRGGNIHINHCKDVIAIINQYIFNDHSEWPIIRIITENLITKSAEILEWNIGFSSHLNCLALTSDNKFILGCSNGAIQILDLDTKKCIDGLKDQDHNRGVTCLALNSDNRLASGHFSRYIKIWDLKTKRCIGILKGHDRHITCLAFTSDNRLISGSDDRTIKIWDLETKKCIGTLEGHDLEITCLALTPDNRLISSPDYGIIKIWNLETKRCIGILQKAFAITCLAFTSDNRLASGHFSRYIKIWDLETKKCIATLEGHNFEITCLALTPDDRLISGSHDKTIKIWNLETKKCIATLENYSQIHNLALTSDNRLISGSDDGTIKIWDLDKFKEVSQKLNVLSICDVATLKIIQDKTQSIWQLENLCVKAKQLGASPILLELLG